MGNLQRYYDSPFLFTRFIASPDSGVPSAPGITPGAEGGLLRRI